MNRTLYLRPGDLVAVRRSRAEPWERGRVLNASPKLVTALCGGVEYRDLPHAPSHVRPLQLAYCRDRGARGAA